MKLYNLFKEGKRRKRKFEKTSYSQCGEDLIVDFIFSCIEPDKQNGKYIDIGAHHPYHLNNTAIFYKKGWSGINVDPLSQNIALFDKERPRDLNMNMGIGNETAVRDFYHMDAETLSTFDKEVADQNVKFGHAIQIVEKIEFISVQDFISHQNIKNDIDILAIDIEGDMFFIIERFLAAGIRPKIIICESAIYAPKISDVVKDKELIERTEKNGYTLYADTFMNSIFVSNDYIKINK